MDRIRIVGRDAATPGIQAIYDSLEEKFHKVPNLFGTVAHHPPALRPLLELFTAVYEQTSLPPRVVELAIIRVAYALQSHYCLTMHKAFALQVGIEEAELRLLISDGPYDRFPAAERAVIEYAAVYATDSRTITDEQYARLREHYSEEQVVNLSLLMGLARLFGDMANSLHIPLDAYATKPGA